MRPRKPLFIIKLINWEYWPWYIVYIPIFAYWLWCGLKVRALFWISAANPGFEYGGIIGASKKAILDMIPAKYRAKGFLVPQGTATKLAISQMNDQGIEFPVILKPDIGERGFHVELIEDADAMKEQIKFLEENLLLQEYLDMPIELGIFYSRLPGEDKGVVSSIVKKRLLKVKGNGVESIRELMQQDPRALQHITRLQKKDKWNLDVVPKQGQEILLEPIGNHIRGTAFLDACDLINPELNDLMDGISKKIEGFFYGRFDIRCHSIEALMQGDFKVMELNGAASEPAHIYAPGYPLLKGYKSLFWHWRRLYKICRINHGNGVPYMSFRTGIEALKKSRFSRE